MKTVPFGRTHTQVPNIVAGMMRIAGTSDDEVRHVYTTARDAGINFFDHADLYGSTPRRRYALCERRFAEAMQLTSSQRAEIVLQTKAGIVPTDSGAYFDYSYEHIVEAANASLTALNTDYIDILLLHRPDALVEPEEVARAFDELAAAARCARSASRTTRPDRSTC